ncbi:MAG: hypothetical protein JST22_17665 [Bacteroidetes bacterium]|nr:hypothetical protein [Bacteroidota bacterium]
MSRIVSINQSEPGLYLIRIQRSHGNVRTLLQAIANPPLEGKQGSATASGAQKRSDQTTVEPYVVAHRQKH